MQKLFLNSFFVLSKTCYLRYVFFIFLLVLVGVIIMLSNCSLFLVFHIWESIVVVNVTISFLVLGQRLLICAVVVCSLFVSDFYNIFGNNSRFFYFFWSQYTGHIISSFFWHNLQFGDLNVSDWSIDILHDLSEFFKSKYIRLHYHH